MQQPATVVIALGSNLGDRALNLRRALDAMRACVRLVRVSSMYETAAIDSPPGAPDFLNMAAAGYTDREPIEVLDCLLEIETRLGRRRPPGVHNAPRIIDLDLILYSGGVMRTERLTVPHPRYRERAFVLLPMREIGW